GYPGTSTRLTCESKGTKRQECPIPAGARIRLVRQISVNECRSNDTYGQGQGYLWVAEGCRGEFEVTTPGQAGGGGGPGGPGGPGGSGGAWAGWRGYPGAGTGMPDRVTCESSNGLRTECRIRKGAQVQLVRQLSTAACGRNNTWGRGVGVLWVNKGCRGEFEV